MTNPNDGKAMSPKANEAMEKVGSIINDQVHAMRSHASVYCSDRESGQMRSEAEFLAEALATLEALAGENAALKREVERLDGAYKWLSQTNTELVEMRETAEAERAEMSRLDAAISYLLEGYKKAHGPAGPPKDPELKQALYEAATFLEAAGKVDKQHALGVADCKFAYTPTMPADVRALIEAIPEPNTQSGSSQSDHKPAEK